MADVLEFDVSGADMLEKVFDQLPQKFSDRIVISTFQKAAKPLVSAIKRNTPRKSGDTRKAVGTVVYRKRKGMPRVSVGYRAQKDGQLEKYMKAYWMSYGTYENRDSSHTFIKGRASRSSSMKGGIKPLFIVEKAWEQTQGNVQGSIESTMKDVTLKLLNKYAVK